MILYNTTFHVEERIETQFVAWLKSVFITSADKAGLKAPMLARLVNSVEPGCVSYALHFDAPDMECVNLWEEGGRQKLLDDMFARWQYSALAFSTPMERVDL